MDRVYCTRPNPRPMQHHIDEESGGHSGHRSNFHQLFWPVRLIQRYMAKVTTANAIPPIQIDAF